MIPNQVLPTMPDRKALRALYDEAVGQINTTRSTTDLTTKFYAETGDAVFEAGLLALSDHSKGSKGPRRVHVVSAPAGGGKTTFSYAFMAAVTRYAESNPNAPYGCAFVVDQIEKAEEAYRELDALMPGKVAIWTSDHDQACKTPVRVTNPTAKFTQDELRGFPIIVVTHRFYNGSKGNKAKLVRQLDGTMSHARALIVVDERPEEVELFETTLKDAVRIREELEKRRPDLSDVLGNFLLPLMRAAVHPTANVISDIDTGAVANDLQWFVSGDADALVKSCATLIPGIDQLFGFARALTQGCAFSVPNDCVVRFVGWQSKLMVRPGMILLDATADIDGVSQICPWRQHIEVPKARYDNLQITHIGQHTKRRLSEYLKTASNQRAYVNWMAEEIKKYMAPGERGLVICKKVLFDHERVPQWQQDDPRFKDPESFTKRYDWDIEGRKLCATHWGVGIGSNNWKDADVVFLFDEFFIPRRVAAATAQGYQGHKANEGDLALMNTLNTKARGVDLIADGHKLRYTKQMGLRGRGRSYDENGVCGKQRLVVSSDLKSFVSNSPKLFPGAIINTSGSYLEGATQANSVFALLGKPNMPSALTTRQLGTLLGKPWRSISSNVLTPEFEKAIGSLGWCYVPGKGRSGSRFERITLMATRAA